MKALIELVSLVTRYKRRQIEILGHSEDSTNNYEIFYDRLEKDKFGSDDEAAAFFFGPDKTGGFAQYQNFKAGFFKRLVNTLFFIDLKRPEFNEAQQAHFNCWKNVAAMRMLSARGARHAAYRVAKKILKPAIKYEITEVVLEVSRQLLNHYSYMDPDRKKQEYYHGLIQKSQKDLHTLIRLEAMTSDLLSPYVLSRSSKPWVAEKAREYLQEIQPSVSDESPNRVWVFYFLIKRLERESMHDYHGTAAVCREAIRYFEGQDSTPSSIYAFFLNTLLVCLTMTGEYGEAEKVAQSVLKRTEKGSPNWFKNRELYLVLQFHKKDYQRAFEVFWQTALHRKFKLLAPAEKESWKIYEGYLGLLIEAGKVSLSSKQSKEWTFRPTKFLNEIPIFAKDKRGMNIPVLIVHAIMLLFHQRHDEAYDRMLALEKYGSRHLQESDDTYRSWCFFQALLQIQKADFERQQAETLADGWLNNMRKQPVQYANAPHEMETIPYEHLWGLAMEALGPAGGGGKLNEQTRTQVANLAPSV